MKATIDAAGRLVVPKALRQALGLKPGQALEPHGRRGKGAVAVPQKKLPSLTAEEVRETLERVRR